MTRISSYTLFNNYSNENDFEEVTPKELMRLVSEGKVNGLKIDVDGEIVPDIEGFNQQNIKIKSAARYRNMIETGKQSIIGYSVVRKHLSDFEESYEIVTSRCGRFKCTPERLKMLYTFADVAGVRLNDDGKIEICEGVEVLDFKSIQNINNCDLDEVVDVGGKLMKVSELDDLTADELATEDIYDIDAKNRDRLEGVEKDETANVKLDNAKSVGTTTASKKLPSKSTGKKKS